jgi:hypothetical protein
MNQHCFNLGRATGIFLLLLASPDIVHCQEAGWQNLFGDDLSKHWTTTGNWKRDKDGVVFLDPRPGEKGWQRYGAYLWAKEKYADFEVEFDYKINKDGNSGFHFNVGDLKSPVKTGLEVQISDLPPKDKLGDHHPGGIIPGIPPTRHAGKPAGEWNHFHITSKAGKVTVVLNGEKINEFSLDHEKIKDRPRSGYLGFQDNARPTWLRNFRIRKL